MNQRSPVPRSFPDTVSSMGESNCRKWAADPVPEELAGLLGSTVCKLIVDQEKLCWHEDLIWRKTALLVARRLATSNLDRFIFLSLKIDIS